MPPRAWRTRSTSSLDAAPGAYHQVITMANPTTEEIIEIAKSGNSGQVKTLSDIRFEKLEKEFAELKANYAALTKTNEELRAANAELYSFASQVSAQEQTPTVSVPAAHSQPVAAAPVVDQSAQIEQKAREENMLNAVLQDMGYRKPVTVPASQSSNNDTAPKDGM